MSGDASNPSFNPRLVFKSTETLIRVVVASDIKRASIHGSSSRALKPVQQRGARGDDGELQSTARLQEH